MCLYAARRRVTSIIRTRRPQRQDRHPISISIIHTRTTLQVQPYSGAVRFSRIESDQKKFDSTGINNKMPLSPTTQQVATPHMNQLRSFR